MLNILRRWRRRRTADRLEVSDAQWSAVESTLPFLDYLPAAERPRLRRMALEFLAEKEFHGAGGLELHDGIMLSVALQACLPVLHLGLDAYAGWVGIVVYPGDFVIPRSQMDEAGVVHEFDDAVIGEAWEGGPVLLAWFEGPLAQDAPEGVNVVIHEFAHKLDMANGDVDGMPPLHQGMRRQDWADAFNAAYQNLCERVDRNEPTALDPYASEHPSEFFAVASEAFFETPSILREAYPAVYRQLSLFYRQDPAAHMSGSLRTDVRP